MRAVRVIFSIVLAVIQLNSLVPRVSALSQSGVVVAQMYPGASGVATQEFVELYNNSSNDVNVTNWCVSYISSSGATTTKLGCLTPPDSMTALWVKAGRYVTIASNEYKTAYPSTAADVYFAGGMSSTAGHVKLTDASGAEVDRLGWGTSTNPEAVSAVAPANTKSIQRQLVAGKLQDTDNNANDFVQATPVLHASGIYEVVTIIDVCPNIPEAQPAMPSGYALDDDGNCQPDSCTNISGLQLSVPDHYDADASGNCLPHDECDNITGTQAVIPTNMLRSDGNNCVWDVVPIVLTEILPNAVGSDTGSEFIEIYNPTNRMVDLSLYTIKVGPNGDKTYAFPIGATIAPGEYRSFSDTVMKFTLVNTTSRVLLTAIDGSTLSDTGSYTDPAEGNSWALIADAWQYTNQSTPGAPNQPFVESEVDATDSSSTACPAGKYRNPLTNRCRNIATDAAVLASCADNQYRSPETGRCRKIDASSLAPCKDNQYRSEETNRCRTIQAASVQKACKDNQYRSEETNRCRNLPASGVPDADFAVQPVKDTAMAFIGWWALGGAVLIGASYAAWEWRWEIARRWQQLFSRSSK